jgi:hypothetical protein
MSVTPIPLRVKVDALLWRAMLDHLDGRPRGIYCGVCNWLILPGQKIQWDHILPEGLGGGTDFKNIWPVHAGEGGFACHKQKTFGSKATSAGSDIHKIAKTKRLAKGPRKRKGRAIQGRGFQKPTVKKAWPKRRMQKRQPGA